MRYDENVVKKSDLKSLSKQISDLGNKVETYKISNIRGKDSLDTALKVDILATNTLVNTIKKQCENISRKVTFVYEHKDTNGNITLNPVK